MNARVLFSLLLASCSAARPLPPAPLTVLAVGESTSAIGGDTAWPAQLEQSLRHECPGVKVRTWAVPGMDSAEAAARLPAGLTIHKPAAVIAMLGINDYAGVTPKVDEGTRNLFRGSFAGERELDDAIFQHLLRAGPWPDRRFVYLFSRPLRDRNQRLATSHLEELLHAYPGNPWVLAELGSIRRLEQKPGVAEASHRRAFLAQPGEVHLLQEWLADIHAPAKFEAAYEAALKRSRNHRPVHFVAASYYQARGEHGKHEKVMRRIVAEGCATRKCLLMLMLALEKNGKAEEAAGITLPAFPEPIEVTRHNLGEVAAEVERAGAAFFLMQYPLLPAAHLERLRLAPVIANEANFRAALAGSPYETFFSDRFAGDFGHFRAPASTLVAASARETLIRWAREKGYCR